MFKLFQIVFFFTFFSVYASENSVQTVKYGYFNLGAYYKIKNNGALDSYDSSFLSIIEEYIPYKFIYVDCGTWANALKMLEKHEIDLVGTMQ